MKTIDSEHVIMVDVDNTLVLWGKDHRIPLARITDKNFNDKRILFVDPYTGDNLYLTPHNVHIRLLRQYKGRGFTIIVWSMAGVKWSESVVKTLGIEDIVDYCMTKPAKHLDDKQDIDSIIGSRVYLENDIK